MIANAFKLITIVSVALFSCCAPDADKTAPETPVASSQSSVSGNPQEQPDQSGLERVLKAAVSHGKVDYALLRRSQSDLNKFLRYVANVNMDSLKGKSEKLAFYANAYNAHVLALVRDRKNLVSVVKEKGFFDQLKVKVAGASLTLNDLEAKARALGDPRIHFIVNCASGSCPILASKPYDAATLEARLTHATRRYLLDQTHGMSIDLPSKTVSLSNIFNWYAKDFAASGKPKDILSWIGNQLGGNHQKQLSGTDWTVKWKKYNWQLNAK